MVFYAVYKDKAKFIEEYFRKFSIFAVNTSDNSKYTIQTNLYLII